MRNTTVKPVLFFSMSSQVDWYKAFHNTDCLKAAYSKQKWKMKGLMGTHINPVCVLSWSHSASLPDFLVSLDVYVKLKAKIMKGGKCTKFIHLRALYTYVIKPVNCLATAENCCSYAVSRWSWVILRSIIVKCLFLLCRRCFVV